jgi:hypothetical protein
MGKGRVPVYYTVGSDIDGWSEEAFFLSPPAVGPHQPVNILVTADVGATEPDNFQTHWSGHQTIHPPEDTVGHPLHRLQTNSTWRHLGDMVQHSAAAWASKGHSKSLHKKKTTRLVPAAPSAAAPSTTSAAAVASSISTGPVARPALDIVAAPPWDLVMHIGGLSYAAGYLAKW